MAGRYDYVQKHVIVGNSGCGKSSLLVRLTDQAFLANSEPTVGVEFGSKLIKLDDGSIVKTHAWDTAGQESFRSITRSYYRGAEGALLCFDVTHRSSWLACTSWLEDVREYAEEGVAVLLVGNKVDLIKNDPSARQVSHEEAVQWAQENGIEYLETSAKSGQNVEEAFTRTATMIHERIEQNKLARKNRKGSGSFPINSLAQGAADQVSGRCCVIS